MMLANEMNGRSKEKDTIFGKNAGSSTSKGAEQGKTEERFIGRARHMLTSICRVRKGSDRAKRFLTAIVDDDDDDDNDDDA